MTVCASNTTMDAIPRIASSDPFRLGVIVGAIGLYLNIGGPKETGKMRDLPSADRA